VAVFDFCPIKIHIIFSIIDSNSLSIVGKSKKAQNEVSINQVAPSISVSGGGICGSSSSVSGTKSPNVLFKGLVPKGSPTNSSNYFFNSNSDSRSINSENNVTI